MEFSRRRCLLLVWAVSIVSSGYFVTEASGDLRFGLATIFGLIAISLGVPLMRALTEFSK